MTKRLTIALVALALFVMLVIMPVSAKIYTVQTNISTPGASVYIGEQGLNLTPAINVLTTNVGTGLPVLTGNTTIAWWASAAPVLTTSPSKTIDLSARLNGQFTVATADFVGYTGNWYLVNSSGYPFATALINVVDPSLDIRIFDADQANLDVTGGSIIQSENLTFRVDTNMYSALGDSRSTYLAGGAFPAPDVIKNTTATGFPSQGYIDIQVKPDSGNVLNALFDMTGRANQLYTLNVSAQPYFWTNGTVGASGAATRYPTAEFWYTGALDQNGQFAYPAGTYTVTAYSYLNAMKDNYKNGGADYTTKTVSNTQTVTLVSNTVSITANKDSVVRSKPFSVTVTGKPNQVYHLWVKGTKTMSGAYDNQPPMIAQNQDGVALDQPVGGAFIGGTGIITHLDDPMTAATNGNYSWQNSGSTGEAGSIWSDVAHGSMVGAALAATDTMTKLGNGTYEYANITLSSSGTRTVQFTTTNWTKAQQYTIRVEQNFGVTGAPNYKSDEVNVQVAKGAVTIVAAGDQSYYLGEEVQFSGTNTESGTTWLFISGPNLGLYGSSMNNADPRSRDLTAAATVTPAISANDWVQASVLGDNTWSYKWGTSNVALDAGTYTIYATSQQSDSNSKNLANVAYGTVSIIIKKPFVSATASQSTVAQGDSVFITGTAQGQPSSGVQVWVLGKNYATVNSQSVNSDASFSYEIQKAATKNLAAGQYFVVVQHPMQNNKFDIQYEQNAAPTGWAGAAAPGYVWNELISGSPIQLFKLTGSGSLQGSDAAEALVQGINSANVDDSYTKLQFLVEVPVINIDPIGDRHVGDKFTVTGTTNLAVDDDVLMQIYSSSFKPTDKSQSGEFSGATGTVKVTQGTSGLNKISFDVDASTFKPDEYIVQASGVLQTATGTALFNVLEGAAPTAVPTVVATTAAPTAVVTTVPPTTVATPTPTPTQPGFGALVALIGLGAVALIVVRRH